MELNSAPLELYIHIPFCTSKCAYCDFVSFPVIQSTTGKKIMEDYTEALITEITARGNIYGKRPVTSIYMGGGTPSVMPAECIQRINEAIFSSFNIKRKVTQNKESDLSSSFRFAIGLDPKITKVEEDYEFTIEVNPGTVTRESLKQYRDSGINRLSIGLQSPLDRDLIVLGRRHTFEQFKEAYKAARRVGFDNINVDLIEGLPAQDAERWRQNLKAVLSFAPEHISAYSLTLEPGTPFYKYQTKDKSGNVYVRSPGGAMVKLPDEETEREMYHATDRVLSAAGFRRYEISNYAIEGFECKHNIGYWRRRDYLGLGLNSASLIGEVRWKNTDNLDEYEEGCRHFLAGEDAVCRDLHKVEIKDQMAEFMFLGLRMTDGISKREFNETFGEEYDDVYGEVTDELIEEDLLEIIETKEKDSKDGRTIKDTRVALTERGIDVSNVAMAYFMPD